jgi:opacity protein-like surface antigen
MRFKHWLFALFFFGFVQLPSAKAQTWELGMQAGGAGYMGDLNPDNPFQFSGLSFGGFLRRNFDPNWALSFNYNYGKIAAYDSKSKNTQFQQRNLSFYNHLQEISLLVDFNFTDYFAGGGFKRFTPYLYSGIAAVIFNPKTTYKGKEYELKLYNTEGQANSYSSVALAIPIGAGVKYNFSDNWSLNANLGYRTAMTDYLDDVSGNYADPAAFSSSNGVFRNTQIALSDRSNEVLGYNIAKKNTQRGDYRKRDTYMFVGIGISYTFVSQKCF